MKLLLTSGGITNPSIQRALIGLLGKPIDQARALCIPTALYGHPSGHPDGIWRFVSGQGPHPSMTGLGWKSIGVLDLTALPSIGRNRWEPWVHEADILLADGGDAMYLCHWMKESGLADLIPSLGDKVWAGVSAGSMVMTPRIGEAFVETKPPITGNDHGLGLVGFSIFPHLDYPGFTENTMPEAEKWAADIEYPAYAIDDQTAIAVHDGKVEVISEGKWRFFPESA